MLSYKAGKRKGFLGLTPYQAWMRRFAEDCQSPGLYDYMRFRSKDGRELELAVSAGYPKGDGYQIQAALSGEFMIGIWLRVNSFSHKPDMIVHIASKIFDYVAADELFHDFRGWARLALFPNLSPRELLEIETLTRVDWKFDILVSVGGKDDLVESSVDQVVSRRKKLPIYTEGGKFTGFDIGSKSRLFFKVYDKGVECDKNSTGDKNSVRGGSGLQDQVARWIAQTPAAACLRVVDTDLYRQDQQVRVWRFESRWNSGVLRSENIKNADQFLASFLRLLRNVYHEQIFMCKRSRVNRKAGERRRPRGQDGIVYAKNPKTPLWKWLMTMTAELSFFEHFEN